MLPKTADAVNVLPPHEHGLNGARLNFEKRFNLSIRVLDGPDFHLAETRGGVTFLNFFATWCPPCRDETNDLVAFSIAHQDDARIVGVNVAEEDDTVRAWRKKYAVPYTIAMDQTGGYFNALATHGYPTTLVFRPDGRLSCVVVGGMDLAFLKYEFDYAIDPTRDQKAPELKPAAASKS